MKKIFILFAFLICSAGLFAQTLPASNTVVVVDNGPSRLIAKGFLLATQSRVTAAYNFVYKVDVPTAVVYSYAVKIIDNTGSNTATAVLSGSLDNTYYKTITSVSYTGNGADTTIIGNITSSPLSYKYYKWTITPSDTMWVKSIFMNFLPLQ
jgi:DUF2075 family protein